MHALDLSTGEGYCIVSFNSMNYLLQGRRYKEWSDVQAYFQLLYFEDDIPGVECRPENAKKNADPEEEEEVTLEEATKATDSKRKRPVATQESSDSEVEAEPVVKKKGKTKT